MRTLHIQTLTCRLAWAIMLTYELVSELFNAGMWSQKQSMRGGFYQDCISETRPLQVQRAEPAFPNNARIRSNFIELYRVVCCGRAS